MGPEGFSSLSSILYHIYLPLRVALVEKFGAFKPTYTDFGPIRHRAFATAEMSAGGDAISAKRILLGNNDVTLGMSLPTESMTHNYRNAQAYETWFTHEGSGIFKSQSI